LTFEGLEKAFDVGENLQAKLEKPIGLIL